VKNQGNKLMTFRAFSIGFSAAVLALACGSESESDDPVDVPEPTDNTPSCAENPYIVGCEPEDGVEPVTPPPGNGGGGAQEEPEESPGALERAAVENILLTQCGGCHGSTLTPDSAEAGMNYIDNIDQLVDNNKIIPLNADESLIIKRMRLGEMPPANRGFDPVPAAEIAIVANFINNPDFWEGFGEPAQACDDVVDFDQLYEEVASDLSDVDEEDAVFTRYISLANRVSSGLCAEGTTLDRDRQALAKMMNSLSVNPGITVPEFVDADRTLYRIDLRDYDWDLAVVVDGVNFDDKWDAVVDANEYAVPFVGQDADDARADSGTDVPVMFLDSMLDVATVGNLYYALVDIDVAQTLDDYILNELEIDVVDNLDQEILARAGTTQSKISRQDRLVEQHPIEAYRGAFYQSFDFEDVDGNESIFEDPFGFQEGGREAVFNLPNGMLAYAIADANGNIVEDSNILLDTSQGNFRALASISCTSCHAAGFIPLVDEVAERTERNKRDLIANDTLNQEELEQIEAVYLPADDFKELVDGDSENYLSALRDADLPESGVDQLSATFQRFDRDMFVAQAAGDLGVSADELLGELDNVDPSLLTLDGGSVDRDDFTAVYIDALCVMSVVLENQPDVAVCDAAAAELDL